MARPDPIQCFREETDAIAAFLDAQLERHGEALFARETAFKRWTVGDIVRHLHLFNLAAHWSLTEPERLRAFGAKAMPAIQSGGHLKLHRDWFGEMDDAQVYAAWKEFLPTMIADFTDADPGTRVEWFGPPMSAESSLIARQMEHWAHCQAVHDLLGVPRTNTDRLYPIAELGVRTYSFAHRIRGLEPPTPKPHIRLTAPSGDVWEWNDAQDDNRVEGSAEAFCQTVTQCRNWKDTDLVATGETAKAWMQIAQCFAGAAEEPPGVGERG